MNCECHDLPTRKCDKCGTETCMAPAIESWTTTSPICPECGETVTYPDSKPTNMSAFGASI